MADDIEQETTLDQQIQEIGIEMANPDHTEYEKRCLVDESIRLVTKRVVSRQLESEPKPRMVNL